MPGGYYAPNAATKFITKSTQDVYIKWEKY